jgi:hypothetical protein
MEVKKMKTIAKIYKDQFQSWNLITNHEYILDLKPILQEGEESISGDIMLGRTKEMGRLAGERDAEWLYVEKIVPAEWKEYMLIFAGTVWSDPDGNLFVPCLEWNHGRWHLFCTDPSIYSYCSGVRIVTNAEMD